MPYSEGDLRSTRGRIAAKGDERSTRGLIRTFFEAVVEVVGRTARAAGRKIDEQFQRIMFLIQFMGQEIFKSYTINLRLFRNIQVFADTDIQQLEEEISKITISGKLIDSIIIEENIDVDGKLKN